jgi:hypothetical protein
MRANQDLKGRAHQSLVGDHCGRCILEYMSLGYLAYLLGDLGRIGFVDHLRVCWIAPHPTAGWRAQEGAEAVRCLLVVGKDHGVGDFRGFHGPHDFLVHLVCLRGQGLGHGQVENPGHESQNLARHHWIVRRRHLEGQGPLGPAGCGTFCGRVRENPRIEESHPVARGEGEW